LNKRIIGGEQFEANYAPREPPEAELR